MGEPDTPPISISERTLTIIETAFVFPIILLGVVTLVELLYSPPDPQSGMTIAYILILWPFISSISVTALLFSALTRHLTNVTVRKLNLALILVHTFAAAYIIIIFTTTAGPTTPTESNILYPLGVIIASSALLTIHTVIRTCITLFQ